MTLQEAVIYIACVLLFIYYLYTRNYSYWKSKGVPYEEAAFPFGSFSKVFTRKVHYSQGIRQMYAKHKDKPYFGAFMFNKPLLVVKRPEVIKKILIKDFDKFINRTIAANEAVDPIAFHNLPSARDGTWKNLRSKLSPVFSSGKIKLMIPLIKECTEELQSFLISGDGQVLELRSIMNRFAVDVISSCAFGINSNCLKNEKSEIFDMAKKLIDIKSIVRNFSVMCYFFIPTLVDLLRVRFVDKVAADYFISVFKSTIEQRKMNKIKRNDLIDLLNNLKDSEATDDGYKFDDIKMAAQAITFLSAGNVATSLTMAFAYYELAVNPGVQERLRKEVVQVFDRYGEFTYDAIQDIKYLDMVVKETLRKYPFTPFLDRETKFDYKIDGDTIEKGTGIHIPIVALHYDSELFPNPEQFDPERFSDENKHKITSCSYLPFGEGPRMCIGERFAMLVSKFALAFTIKNIAFELSERTIVPILLDKGTLLIADADGVYLKVKKL